MIKDVLLLDRTPEVEYINMALNYCKLSIDYKTSYLLKNIIELLAKSGGKVTIDDILAVKYEWEIWWQDYVSTHPDDEEDITGLDTTVTYSTKDPVTIRRLSKADDMANFIFELVNNGWREFKSTEYDYTKAWEKINSLLKEYNINVDDLC